MKNYFSKLIEGKNLITVSKFLLIAVLVLGYNLTFACEAPAKKNSKGQDIGKCQVWSCAKGQGCGSGANECITYNDDVPSSTGPSGQNDLETVYSETICALHEHDVSIRRVAFFINQDIVSPVPDMSPTEHNQYVFKAYPDNSSQQVLGQNTNSPIPVNDPFSIGNLNLNGPIVNGTSNDNTVSIDANGNVPQVFSYLDFTTHVVWPPTGIFSNVQLWNNSLAGTFKTFLSNAWVNNFASNSKWYPLNYLTMDNPASMLPSIPVTLNWVKPALAPNAVAYHLNIRVASNPLGIDDNLSSYPNNEIDIPVLNANTYTFTGRSMVSYFWSVQPLDANGNVIPGPVVIKQGDGFWIGQPSVNDPTCQTIAGHIYFTDSYGFIPGDCNPSPAPSTIPYNGSFTGGYRHGYEFIEFEPKFGINDSSKFEIQYAFRPIPDNTPFTDGTIFNYTAPNQTGNPISIPVKTHVITNISASNSNDLSPNRVGFQYDFGLSSFNSSNTGSTHTAANFLNTIANNSTIGVVGATGTAGVNIDGTDSGIYWRVRALDSSSNPIRKSIYSGGVVTVPAPNVPFQTARPVWTRSNVATTSSTTGRVAKPTTGYVVDMVKNIADFDKLPKLDGVTIDPTVARDGNIATTENNTFLLRKIVPEKNYDSGAIITNTIKENINSARLSYVAIGLSNGDFNELESDSPFMTTMYDQSLPAGIYTWASFVENLINNDNASGLLSNINILNSDYPKMVDTLGINFLASNATNKIVFTTNTPIIVTSTGTASISIAQSQDKKTTTLTFAASSGDYGFNVKTIATPNTYPNLAIPISYDIYGTTALPVLTNKATTEIPYLLPGNTYYWRQRCIMDPDPESPNIGTTKMTFCAWSTPQSITTPIGMPASITVTPTSTAKITASLKNSGLSKKDLQAEINNLKNSSFDIVPAKAKLKGPIKPLDLSKVKPTATQQMKIDPAQLKARVSATQALQKAYEGILKARNSKDGAMLKTAETNFKNAINNLLRQGGSKNLSAAAALSIDSSLLNTMASKITIAIIILFLIIAIAKMYSNWKLKKKEKEDSNTVNM